jgi:putative membrane-bound dehydrogenase-like protein
VLERGQRLDFALVIDVLVIVCHTSGHRIAEVAGEGPIRKRGGKREAAEEIRSFPLSRWRKLYDVEAMNIAPGFEGGPVVCAAREGGISLVQCGAFARGGAASRGLTGSGSAAAQTGRRVHRSGCLGRSFGLAIIAGLLCARPSSGAEPEPVRTNPIPVVAAPPATNGLAAFHLRPGFRLELVAAEPAVIAPVAMAFDENGRLFVVEMRDYAARRAAGPRLGRIRVLDGMNEEGVFQTNSIYADNLPWPSAVACYAGGVFVAATPDIHYFKDTKGDGVADSHRVVLTGFGGTNPPTVQALLNNFNWGIDNRIHGVTAGIGGVITAPDWSGGSVSLAGADFAFDPRTLAVLPETGPAQSGLSFGNAGRRIVCNFVRPLRVPMYELRYADRNAYYPKPPAMLDVAIPAIAVYPFVPEGGTKPRSAGRPETNTVAAAWLTTARGGVVYRGSAFPTNYLENVFVADPANHLVHRFVLRDNGLTMAAERAPDEPHSEFLVCEDPSFRPVQIVNGPDGTLYVADLQDRTDRGRIYRLVPANFKRPNPPQLGKIKTYDLVATLAQGDGWQRDTAARLIYERQDPVAVALLTNMLNNSRLPLARLHALHALEGSGALRENYVLKGLQDPDARVREHAILLSERLVNNGVIPDALWVRMKALATDPSLRVRSQLAFTLGQIRRADRAAVLAQILTRDLGNPWIQNAVMSSLPEGAGDLFVVLAGNPQFRGEAAGLDYLRQLALMIGVRGHLDEVAQTEDFIGRAPLDRVQAYALLYALGVGLHRTRSSLALTDPRGLLKRFYAEGLDTATDPALPEMPRTVAVQFLSATPLRFAEIGDWLLMMCNPPPAPALQSATIATLGHYDDPLMVTSLLELWPALPPLLRNQAVTALLSRDSHVPAVLAAVQGGRIPAADLASSQLDFLRTYRNPAVSNRAVLLFGPIPVERPAAVERFKPALTLTGVSDRGREIFRARCADCHSIGFPVQTLGPDLAHVKIGGREKLLAAILEPNLNQNPDYATCVVQSKDGENFIGIKTDDNLATLTLRQPAGTRLVWPRLNLQSAQTQMWSLMPSGLEQGLSPQNMADLLEYVMTTPK